MTLKTLILPPSLTYRSNMANNQLTLQLGLDSITELQPDKLGNINASLTYCSLCYEHNQRQLQGVPLGMYEEVYIVYKCPNMECGNQWMVCSGCPNQRKRISNKSGLLRHMKRQRSMARKSIQPSTEEEEPIAFESEMVPSDDDIMEVAAHDAMNEDSVIQLFGFYSTEIKWISSLGDGDKLGFPPGSKSQMYFQQCFLSFGGPDYLVKRAILKGLPGAKEYGDFELQNGHARLHMQIAKQAFTMTPTQKEGLVEVLSSAYNVGTEDGYHYLSRKQRVAAPPYQWGAIDKQAYTWSVSIPRSANEIRNNYLEGKFSIQSALPYPDIKEDVPLHSYVSVIDCIRDFLAHDGERRMATIKDSIRTAEFKEVRHTSTSRRAKQLSLQFEKNSLDDKSALKGYVFFWSDDVEPNRLSKAGRGSVWVKTVTIGTCLGDGHNFNNTYPVALGRKGDNHDPIVEKVEEDLKLLRSGNVPPFYVGALKKQVKIFFGDLAHLADQPERRGINYLRLGSGAYAARFGVSANHKECYKVLRACKACQKTNKSNLANKHGMNPIKECPECLNWDFLASNSDTIGTSKPPPNYPLPAIASVEDGGYNVLSPFCRIIMIEGEARIKPWALTYDSLKGAVDVAHRCYCKGGWSANNATAYLKVEGLNDEFITRFMEHANNCYSLIVAEESANDYPEIIADSKRHPAKYKRVPFPPPWNRDGFEIGDNPDVIMHLIFLGIVDSTTQLIQAWLKATKRNAAFIEANASNLDPLIKMDIQWLNVLRYTGRAFGHWVSENYLGFARVMPWFYQNISSVAPSVVKLPPVRHQKKWLKHHNEYWLKARGLDTTGNATVLTKRVAEYLAQDQPPPVTKEPNRPVEHVEEVISALNRLLQCVMATTVTDETINEARYSVRVFLTAYAKLSAAVEGKTEAEGSSIFGVYNLACLMNLPTMMERFGPLRHLWEGATRGEGFLRFVKPMMTQGFKQAKWHVHLHKNLLVTKAYDSIVTEAHGKINPKTGQTPDTINFMGLTNRRKFFQKYESQVAFIAAVSKQQPISVILVVDKLNGVRIFGVVEKECTKVIEIKIPNMEQLLAKFGLHYYNFVPAHNFEIIEWNDIAPHVQEIGYGLLLPLIDMSKPQYFALVADNWKVLGPSQALRELVDAQSATFN